MKLREAEVKVLAAVGLQADISLNELARIVKLRPHVCRHALDSLFSRQMLSRRVVVDPARLGYRIFNLWFSIAPRASRIRQQILASIAASPQVAYLGEFEGEFNYRLDLYVRAPVEVQEFLAAITSKHGPIFSRRALSCTLSVSDFALRFLAPSLPEPPVLTIGAATECVKIDEIDHEVLKLLTLRSNESYAQLARRCGIAVSTFDYRIKRLRASGLIVGFHVLPEVEMMTEVGIPFHLHRMRLLSFDAATYKRIDKFVSADRAVWGCTKGIGDFDLEICCAAVNPRADREFGSRLDAALGDIIDEHACVSIVRHLKVNNYPFR